MSSSPSSLARPSRVIRGPGTSLPAASVVSPRAAAAAAAGVAGTDPGTTLESLVAAARQEAFEQGRQAGLAEAMEGFEARRSAAVSAAVADLARSAAELSALRGEVVDEVVADAVDLAFELVEVLVGHELEVSRTPGRDAVARALALAPEGRDLGVRVHPDSGLTDEEVAAIAGQPGVQVVRDPSVDRDGCTVTIDACHIDAQIPSALERVRRCLEAARPLRRLRRDSAAGVNGTGIEVAVADDGPATDELLAEELALADELPAMEAAG